MAAPWAFWAWAVRNLVRIVDFLPGGYLVGFVTMLLNRRARRLGDFAAGTLVVRLADGERGGAARRRARRAAPQAFRWMMCWPRRPRRPWWVKSPRIQALPKATSGCCASPPFGG